MTKTMFKSLKTIAGFIICLHIYKSEGHQVITANKCIPSKTSFVKLVGISLDECVNACVRRHACQSIGFRRRMNFCELHKEIDLATNAKEDDSCIFIERKDMDVTDAQKCDCTLVGHVCDTNSGECTIAECGHLDLPNGEVYGNVNYVGAQLQITCNKGYVEGRGIKQVICKGNGNWEPTPTCKAEVTPATPVDSTTAQTSTTEMVGTTIPTTSPAGLPPASYMYLGCYMDNKTRLLDLNSINSDAMSSRVCYEHCYSNGTRYFLTEYARHCFCGNVLLRNYEIRPDNECNMSCAGNSSESCGGFWRGSLYIRTNLDIHYCNPNPCQNGGSCTEDVNIATCACAAGFTGSTCRTNINYCSPNPCQNGGICFDGISSFTCTCAADFSGSTCQTQHISQWVQTVTAFSSEFTSTNWSANQVIGPPNVYPVYDEWRIAQWEPRHLDANQFLEVQFAEPVSITGVEIYETSNAGMVKAIKALYGGSWKTLWSTETVQSITSVRIFSPTLLVIASPSRDLRVEVNCTSRIDWIAIDAIKLLGTK